MAKWPFELQRDLTMISTTILSGNSREVVSLGILYFGPLLREVHRKSGGTTCLTLLLQRRCSSKVAKNAANSISRMRQVMPQKTNEAVLDKQCHPIFVPASLPSWAASIDSLPIGDRLVFDKQRQTSSGARGEGSAARGRRL